jgi:phosphatidylinositol glycan class F
MQAASLQLPLDEVYGMTLGAVVGAWAGAVPIPLDWDREWQKWPDFTLALLLGSFWAHMLSRAFILR